MKIFLATTSLPILATLAFATPSYAQAAAQPAAAAVDEGEIVVTARRTAERLQDVPMSVTALSGEQLKLKNVVTFADLTRIAPGVRFERQASPGYLNITSRGQTVANADSSLDLSVGVYIDGVLASRVHGLAGSLVDVSQVQVLRGPQGTLFGRNTPGGAVLINTNDPEFGDVNGRVEVTAGSYGRSEFTGVLNIPIIDDVLAVRFVGKRRNYDGYGTNLTTGLTSERGLAAEHTWLGRVKVLVTPASDLRMLLGFERNTFRGTTPPDRALAFSQRAIGIIKAGDPQGDPTDPAFYLNTDGFKVYNGRFQRQSVFPNITPDESSYRVSSAFANISYDFGEAKLTAIGGYRRTKSRAASELDGTPYLILTQVATLNWTSYSGELQISGRHFNDRLSYQGGFYYFHEDGADTGSQTQDTNSYAVYAQLGYKILDTLTLTGGIRYFVDHKNPGATSKQLVNGQPVCQVPPQLLNNTSNGGCALFHLKESRIPFTVSLEFKPNPEILVYGKVARGFRSGGYNARAASTTNPALFGRFGPEELIEYEAGVKLGLSRRLIFNVSGYYDDYKHIQRTSTQVLPGNPQPIGLVSANAKGAIWGAEVETSYRVAPELTVGGTFAYTRTKYDRFFDQRAGGAIVDRRDEPFTNTPKWSFTLYANYEQDIGIGTLTANVNYFRTARVPNVVSPIEPGTLQYIYQPSYGLLNARTGIRFPRGFEAAVFATNLLDTHYDIQRINTTLTSTAISALRAAPREFGVTVGLRF